MYAMRYLISNNLHFIRDRNEFIELVLFDLFRTIDGGRVLSSICYYIFKDSLVVLFERFNLRTGLPILEKLSHNLLLFD